MNDSITPRDLFAAAALQGMMANNWAESCFTNEMYADEAFSVAEVMMERRADLPPPCFAGIEVEAMNRMDRAIEKWAPVWAKLTQPMTAQKWYEAVEDQGISRATFFRYMEAMRVNGLIEMNPENKKWGKTH